MVDASVKRALDERRRRVFVFDVTIGAVCRVSRGLGRPRRLQESPSIELLR